jgi:hypothetical protein
VVVTRETGLEQLLERFVTCEQARFYPEHSGVPFEPYEAEQSAHDEALTVEADYLSFDSGAVASIAVAEEKARLVAA